MSNSLEGILNSQVINILNMFLLDLEETLKNKNSFSQEKKEEILKDLLDIIELTSPNQDVLTPEIKDKINQIKHLLESLNEMYDLKKDHQITPENGSGSNN